MLRLVFWSAVTAALATGCAPAPLEGTTSATAQSEQADIDLTDASLSEKIDLIFEDYANSTSPGCAVGVSQDGTYIHSKGYGLANLEHGIPITGQSVFRIASVSKQFTALAIAILADRGELDLDADVHTYLPDLPEFEAPVTVRQMVHHISGMGDYDLDFEVSPGKEFRFGNQDYWTNEEFLDQVLTKPLALPPGEQFQYSNLAYYLLGQVVERVSGQTLREFAAAEIFGPLDMTHTFFNDNVNGVVPNRADAYVPTGGGTFEILMTNLSWVGDGGVYTSLDDFVKWDQALLSGDVPGGAAVYDLITTPHPSTVNSDGDDAFGYGFGMFVGTQSGRAIRSHSGGWVGFRTYYASLPEEAVSVIYFCNRADAPGHRQDAILELVVAELIEQSPE